MRSIRLLASLSFCLPAMIRTSSRVLAGCLFLGAATAQTINWGPVQPSVAPTDVSVQGALVFAGNAHQPGVPTAATVNGVTFAAGFQPTGWAGFITGGLNGSTTGNVQFDRLLGTSLAMQTSPASNPTGWGGIRLDTLATLVPGRTYAVQVWFTDQRTGAPTNVLYDRVMTLSSANAQVDAGKLRLLAVSSSRRVAAYPNTPTFAELGHPQLTGTTWFSLSGPPGMPAAVVARLNDAVRKGLQTSALLKQLATESMESMDLDAPAFTQYVVDEIARWSPAVKLVNSRKG
jgi:hypothetical protein